MIVFGATSGEYSDYRLDVLFTKRALAEKFVADGKADRVEEFHLLDSIPKLATYISARWDSKFPSDVTPHIVTDWDYVVRPFRGKVKVGISHTDPYAHAGSPTRCIITATGSNAEEVVKAVDDHRIAWIMQEDK